jgi:hypothetical protein
MKFKKNVVVNIFVFPFLLTGCVQYTYNGKVYNSQNEAISASNLEQEKLLASVSPRSKPIAKKGKCMMLSKAGMIDRGLFGNDSFKADIYYADYQNTCKRLQKRNIFTEFEIAESDGDHVKPTQGESTIYFYTPDKSHAGWYYVSTKIPLTPLNFDRANLDKFKKVKYFDDSVEALVASE